MFDELKQCPFCGSKACLFVSDGVRITCPKCGASSICLVDTMTVNGPTGNATKHVIDAWNKRVREAGELSMRGDSIEDAEEKALQRPLQKPLTLEEFCERLCSPVWFESHGTYMSKKGWWMIPQKFIRADGLGTYGANYVEADPKRDKKVLIRFVCEPSSQSTELALDAYGSVWRAWATKPTYEEREAARWQ